MSVRTDDFAFDAPYAADDVEIARGLFSRVQFSGEQAGRIRELSGALIRAIRRNSGAFGGVEELLREYSLSSREGLALMVLAEALLRVPDAATADRLIEDKLGLGDFIHHEAKSSDLLVNASAWALGIAARVIGPEDEPDSILQQLSKRIGLPALRLATRQAMRLLGNHFVLGQTIGEALERAGSGRNARIRYSFDMLGEGARTTRDATRYFESYANAIDAIGRADTALTLPERSGISVKLSALHPVYEALNRECVHSELMPRVLDLARKAKEYDLNFTIDAEEADRLELSLEIFAAVLADPSLKNWDGYGLAVQAYQKRAGAVIGWVGEQAKSLNRRLMVRLVKGAYWDTEIKRAQERGLADYPVFTRKAMTDLNYIACAQQLLALRGHIFPQFATHNATTVASVLVLAEGSGGYEFQRLHGMGDALYREFMQRVPEVSLRIYAPVGSHKNLLAYLVRRLLENGANSSFVHETSDPSVPVERLLRSPQEIIGTPGQARHPSLRLPRDLFAPLRKNSRGIEFGHRASLNALLQEMSDQAGVLPGLYSSTEADVGTAFAHAARGYREWRVVPVQTRAAILEKAANLLELRRGRFLHLLQIEGGKTLDDAIAELREAVDFCRYYAAEAVRLMEPQRMPGPTGESNFLGFRPRGIFVAISPWNFPLAIFTGQIAAALVAGNAVIAKPAEQTPAIASEMVKLLHGAGVPAATLHLIIGDGKIGAKLVEHEQVDGVVFTGSTETARFINRTLAAKDGPIVPLIAETGGINAMIVDATALPEQVSDDVVRSAFQSAGQRCSALRLLCIQEDVADTMLEMIIGAARELKVGDPRDLAVKVGPVIDNEAKTNLDRYITEARALGRVLYAGETPADGNFVAPHIIALESVSQLTREVFGPILHIVRYRRDRLEQLLNEIAETRYALTLGIHSRIQRRAERIVERLSTGNIYVNRNMIGAVVGVQPFGGHGLSGTGPKAGGPNYMPRFMVEQTVTTNTAAAGGNAELLAMEEKE